MADEMLFLENEHAGTQRIAILEDDGISVWLYLTESGTRRPIADAWVCNRITAPPTQAIKSFRGGPPPAAQGYASDSAICEDPLAYEWSFLWSLDGEAVAVFKDDQAVAFVAVGQKGGYSRELVKKGPWGKPWSESLYEMIFGSANTE